MNRHKHIDKDFLETLQEVDHYIKNNRQNRNVLGVAKAQNTVLQHVKAAGVTLNSEKCEVSKTQLKLASRRK